MNIKTLPKALGPYSQLVRAGDLLFISGQLPIDPNTALPISEISAATHQCMDQIEAILNSVNLTLDHIVRVEIFLKDINDFQIVNEAYQSRFQNSILPTRQVIQVARLPKDAIIEISCIASFASNKNPKNQGCENC